MADAKKIGDLTVNDGKGLYDNDGMFDAIIVKINTALKSLMDGQTIDFCGKINESCRMILVLKQAVINEREGLKNKVEDLKRFNHELNEEICKIQGQKLEDEFTKKGGAE